MLMFKLKQLLLYWPGNPGVANSPWSQLSHLTVNFSEVSRFLKSSRDRAIYNY